MDVTRTFTQLKMSLMPYLSELGRVAHVEGIPVMRPMVLEFPDDRTAATVDTQYLLGDALLVAPVFSEDGWVDFYLPEGTWTHLLSGERLAGPRWHRQRYGFDSLPLFVRPGSVLPRGARVDRPDYDHADGVTLEVYELADGAERRVDVGEASFVVRRTGDELKVAASGTDRPWHVRVRDRAWSAEGSELVADLGQG